MKNGGEKDRQSGKQTDSGCQTVHPIYEVKCVRASQEPEDRDREPLLLRPARLVGVVLLRGVVLLAVVEEDVERREGTVAAIHLARRHADDKTLGLKHLYLLVEVKRLLNAVLDGPSARVSHLRVLGRGLREGELSPRLTATGESGLAVDLLDHFLQLLDDRHAVSRVEVIPITER